MVMPAPDKLSTATGQLGPICSVTGKPITFSEAIVVDDKYVCYEAYVELMGQGSATDSREVPSKLPLE